MNFGQATTDETASGLGRARQVLRDQLDILVRLAAIALRMFKAAAEQMGDPARTLASPLINVFVVEKTIHRQARVFWALRLIRALRAKLLDDLARVERGEVVDVFREAAEPGQRKAEAERGERAERAERERGDSESFGRYFSNRSGDAEFAKILKRPTEEVIALIRQALGAAGKQERDGEDSQVPFPLDGGRARDGGGVLSGKPPDG